MAESIQIVAWWHDMKDLNKVRWRYAKENGIEKFRMRLISQSLQSGQFSGAQVTRGAQDGGE